MHGLEASGRRERCEEPPSHPRPREDLYGEEAFLQQRFREILQAMDSDDDDNDYITSPYA